MAAWRVRARERARALASQTAPSHDVAACGTLSSFMVRPCYGKLGWGWCRRAAAGSVGRGAGRGAVRRAGDDERDAAARTPMALAGAGAWGTGWHACLMLSSPESVWPAAGGMAVSCVCACV